MKTNKRILKELKKSIEKNISIPTEWRYVVIKELNVGDVFISTVINDSKCYTCYLKIVEFGDDNKLFFVNCDRYGNILEDIDSDNYYDFVCINDYAKENKLLDLVSKWTLMPVK